MSLKVDLKVLTQAYEGSLDQKFSSQLDEVIPRGKVSRLVIVSKDPMLNSEGRAMRFGIPVLHYDTPKEFCAAYNEDNSPLRKGEGHVICIAESLTAAGKVLKGVKSAHVELSTDYRRQKFTRADSY